MVCYLNLRDNRGNIIGKITSLSVLEDEQKIFVPAMGKSVDLQVDCFGYLASYVNLIYNSRLSSKSFREFVRHLPGLPVYEAYFYWELIELPPPGAIATHRQRKIGGLGNISL